MFETLPYDLALTASRVSHLFGVLPAPTFLQFVLLFIGTGQPKKIPRVYYISSILLMVACLTPWVISALPPKRFFPYYPEPGPIYASYIANYTIVFLHAFLLLYQVHRNSETDAAKRKQIFYVLTGVFVAWLGVGSLFLLIYNVPVTPALVPLPFIGVFISYAIVRHQLLDIRIVISQTLVYSGLIACITASYLIVVLIAERLFQGFFGYRSFIATAVVAFLIAIFFNPVRNRIQAFVDRALFKATPAELVVQREQLLAEVRKGEQMKAVGTLAAGLAHEIKNPLASIKTFTEHLDSRYDDPAFRQKFRKIVGGEVERINLIVQQLLEFAKPVPPKLAPIDVPQLVDETLDFLNSELMAHHVEVERCYESRATVLADSQQLKQVFLNLVLNSLQAMNGNGRLRVSTAVKGSELELTMTDNGSGIAAENLPKVFEPFFTTKANGTGLGLAVVHGIVKEHGGRIVVESEPMKGTVVRLKLPIAV